MKRDQPVVEVITDKVTVEIPSPVEGVLEKILATPGQVVRVGETIALFAGAGEAPPHCTARLGRAEIGNYLLGMPYFSSGHLLVVALDGELSAAVCGDTASTGE